MSDDSEELITPRQVGGSNQCQRRRIHADVNDFNDTVWLDAIEKVNECSRNICESLNVCENEAGLTDPCKDPCLKKSSKSIYADCHSRQFQDEPPSPQVCKKCSHIKTRRPCGHNKLKDVFNAIEDLYGIAAEHRSQHECPNCGGFKQSVADICNPCSKSMVRNYSKEEICESETEIEEQNVSRWIPVTDSFCPLNADLVKDDTLRYITQRVENICTSIGCSCKAKEKCPSDKRPSESICEDDCNDPCLPPVTKTSANPCFPKKLQDCFDPCLPPVRKMSAAEVIDPCQDTCLPRVRKLSAANPCLPQKQQDCQDPCLSSKKSVPKNQKNCQDPCLPPPKILDPCLNECQPINKEQKTCNKIKDMCLNACIDRCKKDLEKEKVAEKKDSCLDICIEPSYTKLQNITIPETENAEQKFEKLTSPVGSEVMCTLNRICEILSNYEKNLKESCNKCECSHEKNVPSYTQYNYPSGPNSEGFTTPLTKFSDGIIENKKANSDEIEITDNKSAIETINLTDTEYPAESTYTEQTSDNKSTADDTERTTDRIETDRTAETFPENRSSENTERATDEPNQPNQNGNPNENRCGSGGFQGLPFGQNCCCFPCIPIYPMPMCSEAMKCWPCLGCPSNCSSRQQEKVGCNRGCRNNNCSSSNNNSGVHQFVNSLMCDIDDMKKTLNCCMSNSEDSSFNKCDFSQCPTGRPPPPPVCCQGFPASIHCVRPLGNKSLMVYWMVHDFRDISGYEIRLDGCMKNRYFTSGHDCAVLYGVDLCVPHEIELVAIPELKCPDIDELEEDFSTSLIPISTQRGKRKSHFQSNGSVWTPSVYIYNPR